jgi:hypothetical protein
MFAHMDGCIKVAGTAATRSRVAFSCHLQVHAIVHTSRHFENLFYCVLNTTVAVALLTWRADCCAFAAASYARSYGRERAKNSVLNMPHLSNAIAG